MASKTIPQKTIMKESETVPPPAKAATAKHPAKGAAHDDGPQGSEKVPAVVTHVLGLLTLFVGPLIMYFIFKGKASPWLRAHLDEAVNYHILVVVAVVAFIAGALFLNGTNLSLILFGLAILVVVMNVVFSIIAIIWAGRGKSFHFPLDIKMIR